MFIKKLLLPELIEKKNNELRSLIFLLLTLIFLILEYLLLK
jgi:hypothetical protein